MEIIDENNIYTNSKYKAIALGNFDGIHLGHQALLNNTVKLAKNNHIASAVFSFRQHTMEIINPEKMPFLLITLKKKIKMLSQFDLDYCILFNFTKEYSKMQPEDFIKNVLVDKLKMKIAIVGENYRFGYNASGDVKFLKEASIKYGYNVNVIKHIKINDKTVSSSYIRDLIKLGEIEEANKCLGHYFSLEGYVTEGEKIGRELGFPTANIKIDENLIRPNFGVYLTRIKIADNYFIGVTNIGFNPTFKNRDFSIETFILDFNGNIYGKFIEIEFIKKIRDEIKFRNIEDLIQQINNDVIYAQNYKNILQE